MLKEAYFEKQGIRIYNENCLNVLPHLEKESINLIFADPPYYLSNGGITCKGGKISSVNKAEWDKSKGFEEDLKFTLEWIKLCKDILKPEGTIWISGTHHNIFQVGYALQSLGFFIMNEIIWYKPNAPPNLTCKYFTHSHESIIWARKEKEGKHFFNYELMKNWEDKISPQGKQMRNIWNIPLTPSREKINGVHPTQKPIELLQRIILSNSKEGDTILDPFLGSGTTALVSKKFNRKFIGTDIEKKYCNLTIKRLLKE